MKHCKVLKMTFNHDLMLSMIHVRDIIRDIFTSKGGFIYGGC